MSILRERFESIDYKAIEGFVAERRQEDLHLDFKRVRGEKDFEKDDKSNLAKAVSGFANSDGGIVVWGIDARKLDGVDGASDMVPIRNIDHQLSRLRNLAADAASPIVDGVDHKAIRKPDSDSGFLVTLVPRSDSGPHMAKLGEDRYYKRSGDTFQRLEHFDLEDMFGRRPRAILSLDVLITPMSIYGTPNNGTVEVILEFGIRNSGRGIARFPRMALELSEHLSVSRYGIDGNGNTALPRIPRRQTHNRCAIFAGGADHVVHSEQTLFVTSSDRIGVSLSDPVVRDIEVCYSLAADGIAPNDGRMTIEGQEIKRRASEHANRR